MKLALGLLLVLLVSCSPAPEFDSAVEFPRCVDIYFLQNKFQREAIDLDKQDETDSQMCWALSALNMYLFSINAPASDAGQYLDYIKKKVGNRPATTLLGLQSIYEFNEKEYNIKRSLQSDITTDTNKFNDRMDLWIKGALLQRCVVGLFLRHPFNRMLGHALTCYGYIELDGQLYVRYADPDDKDYKLYIESIGECPLTGKTIFTSGDYIGYKIAGAIALKVVPKHLPKYKDNQGRR